MHSSSLIFFVKFAKLFSKFKTDNVFIRVSVSYGSNYIESYDSSNTNNNVVNLFIKHNVFSPPCPSCVYVSKHHCNCASAS